LVLINNPHAESFTPPLTSVAMPYFEQGENAVDVICKILDGEKVQQKTLLKSQLVLHRSCGCKSESVTGISTDVQTVKFEKCLIEDFTLGAKLNFKKEKRRVLTT
jgi:hypothetical protein